MGRCPGNNEVALRVPELVAPQEKPRGALTEKPRPVTKRDARVCELSDAWGSAECTKRALVLQ